MRDEETETILGCHEQARGQSAAVISGLVGERVCLYVLQVCGKYVMVVELCRWVVSLGWIMTSQCLQTVHFSFNCVVKHPFPCKHFPGLANPSFSPHVALVNIIVVPPLQSTTRIGRDRAHPVPAGDALNHQQARVRIHVTTMPHLKVWCFVSTDATISSRARPCGGRKRKLF